MSDQFARDPVPDEAANRPARTVGMIVSNAVMGVPVIMLGASLGKDYGFPAALLVILLGCAVTAGMASLGAVAGVRSRRSAALLAERTFGLAGARLLNVSVAIGLLGWLSVELGFIGQLVKSGAENGFEVSLAVWPGILAAGACILAITLYGISLIGKAPLFFLPLLGFLLFWVAFHALQANHSEVVPATGTSLGTGVSAIVGGYIVGCLIMPDYSRFVRSAAPAVAATWIALGFVYAVVLLAYAYGGNVVGSQDPAKILIALGVAPVLTLILPVGLMQNGVMCLYSSTLAISTIFRRISFGWCAVALMAFALLLALAGVEGFFVEFLVALGIVFPPATALMIHSALIEPVADERRWHWPHLVDCPNNWCRAYLNFRAGWLHCRLGACPSLTPDQESACRRYCFVTPRSSME
jgi:cytosine permease